MRVVVTGGSGLVGRALVASLVADGHETIVLSRDPGRVRGLPAGVEVVRWDAATTRGWGHLVDGAGAVVNLTGENLGEGRWTAERKRRIVESRTIPGKAIVQAIEAAGNRPEVVIQASAVGYYGTTRTDLLDESAGPGTDFLAEVCVAWEASTAPVEALGVRQVVTRSGMILSKDGGALPRMLLPFRLFVGGPVGGGRQGYSWITLTDEVAAIRFLIEDREARGPFNLTAPEPVTSAEFARAIGRVLGRPSWFPAPTPIVQLVFGEMSTMVLEGQLVVPRRLLERGFKFQYPELEAALRHVLG